MDLLPRVPGEPSIYETLHEYDASSDQSDPEERAGITALDEENLATAFHDYELDENLADPAMSLPSSSQAARANRGKGQRLAENTKDRYGRQLPQSRPTHDEHDDDVPSSLLFEGGQDPELGMRGFSQTKIAPPVPGPVSPSNHAKWLATQKQQRLYEDVGDRQARNKRSSLRTPSAATIDPRERAMWRWANVQNLDNFLTDVYDYYLGNGIWCILLSRVLNLL